MGEKKQWKKIAMIFDIQIHVKFCSTILAIPFSASRRTDSAFQYHNKQ